MKKILFFVLFIVLLSCANQEDPIKQEIKNMNAKEVYLKANYALTNSSYERAIKLYNALENAYPYGVYAQQGMLDLAYAYYKNSNLPMALSTLDQFMILYQNSPNIDYALYLKGVINYKGEDGLFKYFRQKPSELDIEDLNNSYLAFNQLVNDHPKSKYTNQSKEYIKVIVNNLAKSEINKSAYYLSINANLAAISHAQKILTHYKSSNYIEDALAIEISAYRNLGQLQVSQDTQKILLLNFPNSKYLNSTWQSDDMAWYKIFN